MDLGDLLAGDAIIPALKATSKKQVLQDLSEHAAGITGLSAHDIFSRILQRERLSSTGLGRGIAVPHAKLGSLKSIVGIFARLDQPIDFESPDQEPVDLIFLLLSPEHASGDHLKALAKISRIVRDSQSLEQLRAAPDQAALKHLLTAPPASHAA
jgi:PTS system nitrogen regulatory IIA component